MNKKKESATLKQLHQIEVSKEEINSDSSPSAQSTKLCDDMNKVEELRNVILTKVMGNAHYHVRFKLLTWILLHTGCRISEVLRLNGVDFVGNYIIHIRASKGSFDRIVSVPPMGLGLDFDLSKLGQVFNMYSRFFVYREFKKIGIMLELQDHINTSVTHSLRHLYTMQTQQLTIDFNSNTTVLGHKNKKNIEGYGKQKKKSD